jgi:hypothetical protein
VAYQETARTAVAEGWAAEGLRIADINKWTLDAWREGWANRRHPHGEDVWDWEGLVSEIHGRSDRFGFAIWQSDNLCGLARGHVSKAGNVIALDYLEGSPNRDHPLKGYVIEIAIAACDALGHLCEAKILRLMKPRAVHVGTYISRYGFAVVDKGGRPHYCEREIQ